MQMRESPEPLATTRQRPRYEPPLVTSYTDEQILAELGPAQALTSVRMCLRLKPDKRPKWCKDVLRRYLNGQP